MFEFKKYRKVYIINEVNEHKFQICKVLNEYDTLEGADNDLLKLLTNRGSENELLEKFNKKEL